MSDKLNIYQKMLAITTELPVLGKNSTVNGQYSAVTEADVLYAVKDLERKYGIYSYPLSREIVDLNDYVTVTGKGNEVHNKYVRIMVTYRFVDIDEPERFIDVTSYGDGIDSNDKAPGKAMTYADKYALMKAYKITTSDDPDSFVARHASIYDNDVVDEQPVVEGTKEVVKVRAEVLEEAKALNIASASLAKYYKKSEEELTEEDYLKAIEMKRSRQAKKE